jgi:hypothetical protein
VAVSLVVTVAHRDTSTPAPVGIQQSHDVSGHDVHGEQLAAAALRRRGVQAALAAVPRQR